MQGPKIFERYFRAALSDSIYDNIAFSRKMPETCVINIVISLKYNLLLSPAGQNHLERECRTENDTIRVIYLRNT